MESVTSLPVAETPVYDGGFKNLTHRIVYSDLCNGYVITVTPTFTQLLLYYVLLLMGGGLFFININAWIMENSKSIWSSFFASFILLGIGTFGLLKIDEYEFYLTGRIILHKRNRLTHYMEVNRYNFRDMRSLQVINKLITTGKGITPYRSYEMNLVFKSGNRVNLLHDNDFERLSKTVEKLSSALNIPCDYILEEQCI